MSAVNTAVSSQRGDLPTEHRAATGVIVSAIFTFLAIAIVNARFYTRVHIINRVEANDIMVVIALVFSLVFFGLFIAEAKFGMGWHGADIPPAILMKQMKVFWLTVPFYNASVLCAKASILLQYFRVFPTKKMRIACWTLLIVLATYGTWAVLSAFLNCVPVAKFWNPTLSGYCLNTKGLWFSNASMHIVTDLAILVLPIPALITLDISTRQKIALGCVFALGGFVCVTSIIRLHSLKVIADSTDPTYDNPGAAMWSAIECNTGIICACLPTLRPLINRLWPRFLSTLSGSRSQRHTATGKTPTYRTGTQNSTIGGPGDDVERMLESHERSGRVIVPKISRDGNIELHQLQLADADNGSTKDKLVKQTVRQTGSDSSSPEFH